MTGAFAPKATLPMGEPGPCEDGHHSTVPPGGQRAKPPERIHLGQTERSTQPRRMGPLRCDMACPKPPELIPKAAPSYILPEASGTELLFKTSARTCKRQSEPSSFSNLPSGTHTRSEMQFNACMQLQQTALLEIGAVSLPEKG